MCICKWCFILKDSSHCWQAKPLTSSRTHWICWCKPPFLQNVLSQRWHTNFLIPSWTSVKWILKQTFAAKRRSHFEQANVIMPKWSLEMCWFQSDLRPKRFSQCSQTNLFICTDPKWISDFQRFLHSERLLTLLATKTPKIFMFRLKVRCELGLQFEVLPADLTRKSYRFLIQPRVWTANVLP